MDRICNEALLRKVTTPRAAAAHIKNGMTVGFSGFTVIGYPKVLPAELARRAEEGEELGITVITGGNVGDQLDGVLARSGVMKRRYGFQGNRDLRALANADRIQYVDTHVSHGPYLIKNGYLGKIDVAVIEVAAIRADGSLVLPFSVGIDDTLVKYADKLILEVNEAIPLEVEGMHDILTLERAPHTQAIEIFKPDDRVGSPYLPCDPDKVAAVILTNCEDTNQDLPAPTPDMEAIASHIVKFLQSEVAAGRLPNPLPPMQSGVGGVANAVLSALARSELDHLSVYTEVMQDAVVELIDAGKVACASGTALTISPSARERFYAHIDDYKGKIILRPQELSNAPEVIRRLSISANKLLDEGGGAEGARGGAAGPVHRLCREGEAGAGGSGRPRSGAEAPGGHAGHQEAVRQERHPQGDEPGGWRHGQRAQPNDRRASGMSGPYDDIINLPHPTSKRHPRMPIRDRAAIFSPFAALSGHGAAIAETARLTEQKIELDEDTKAELDRRQAVLLEYMDERPELTVTWFQRDEKKDGGAYLTTTGRLKKLRELERSLVLTDGTEIPLEDVVTLESDIFQTLM